MFGRALFTVPMPSISNPLRTVMLLSSECTSVRAPSLARNTNMLNMSPGKAVELYATVPYAAAASKSESLNVGRPEVELVTPTSW